MLLQVMDRTKWPQGSVDRQKVADKVNLAYHQVDYSWILNYFISVFQITHQYRVHPENQMYMQNSKRQTREKITVSY